MSIGSTFIARSSARCSGVLLASMAPKSGECRVLTLPERDWGRFMSSWRLRTGMPASFSAECVPPVASRVISNVASSRANSISPLLSATLIRAVFTSTRLSSMTGRARRDRLLSVLMRHRRV